MNRLISHAHRTVSLCITLWFGLNASIHAASTPASSEQCPAAIPKSAATFAQAPVGWLAYNPDRLPLRAAGFSAGPPAMDADLKPFESAQKKTGWVSTWKFDPGEFDGDDGLWLSCAYGDKNLITLSKKIDSATRECTVTYQERKKNVVNEVVVVCR